MKDPGLLFTERLRPPWWSWALVIGFAASLAWVVDVAIGPTAGTVVGVVTFGVMGAGVVAASRTVVRVRAGGPGGAGGVLTAGPATLDLLAVHRAAALDPAATAALRGPGFDPLAYQVVRGSRPGSVRLDLADPGDPTPYWCVSTTRPGQLVAAIARARRGDPD